MFNKNDEFEVNIIDYGRDGEGIAKVDNFTLFIPGAMKGERCKIHVTKVNKNFGFAKLIEVIEKSKERCSPDCIISIQLASKIINSCHISNYIMFGNILCHNISIA